MKPNWLIVGLVTVTALAAAAAGVGWYKYYSLRSETEYALLKSFFVEEYRIASEKYTPATVVSTEGDRLTYRIPKQVVRDGEIYVDSELQTAIVSDATQFFTLASTSLDMTVFSIPPGTQIRIHAPPSPADPDTRYAQLIYVSIDVIPTDE